MGATRADAMDRQEVLEGEVATESDPPAVSFRNIPEIVRERPQVVSSPSGIPAF